MGRPKKVPVSETPAAVPPVVSVTDEKPAATVPDAVEIPASKIGDDLISGMPEMKPGEVRAIVETETPPEFRLDGEEPAPSPGEPTAKKKGRPKGSKSAKEKAKEQAGAAAVMSHDPNTPDKYDASAELYVEGAIFAASTYISQEWQPRVPNEQAGVKKALAGWMRLKQMDEPPAWVVLLGSVMLYAGPRLAMPETKAKISKLLGKEEAKNPESEKPPAIPPAPVNPNEKVS